LPSEWRPICTHTVDFSAADGPPLTFQEKITADGKAQDETRRLADFLRACTAGDDTLAIHACFFMVRAVLPAADPPRTGVLVAVQPKRGTVPLRGSQLA
jgi:hypothetical protein